MTIKVYRENPYLRELQSNVMEKRYLDNKFYIKLDRTIFYPHLSGGQPGDKGFINDIEVLESYEEGDDIVHVLLSNISGNKVTVVIDWENRIDIMQQHTGQHLLSAVFYKLFDGETVGFNVGENYVYVDIAIPDFTDEDAQRVEVLANKIIQSNFQIKSYYVDNDKLDSLPLRKKPTVSSDIRIVEIDGFDYNPCGGTHLGYTGEIGIIKIRKWEKRNGNIRVEFLCGNRALNDYIWKNKYIREIGLLLTTKDREVLNMVNKLYLERENLQKDNRELRENLLKIKAESFLRDAQQRGELQFICMMHEDIDFKELTYIAGYLNSMEKIIQVHGLYNGDKAQFYVSRTKDINVDLNVIFKRIASQFEIKGGGSPAIVQGGASKADLENIAEKFTEEILKEIKVRKTS